jgi:hypothetical protein
MYVRGLELQLKLVLSSFSLYTRILSSFDKVELFPFPSANTRTLESVESNDNTPCASVCMYMHSSTIPVCLFYYRYMYIVVHSSTRGFFFLSFLLFSYLLDVQFVDRWVVNYTSEWKCHLRSDVLPVFFFVLQNYDLCNT